VIVKIISKSIIIDPTVGIVAPVFVITLNGLVEDGNNGWGVKEETLNNKGAFSTKNNY